MDEEHPSIAQLSAYAAGRSAPSEAEEIEAHLAVCEACGLRIDELDIQSDPLVCILRKAFDAPSRETDQSGVEATEAPVLGLCDEPLESPSGRPREPTFEEGDLPQRFGRYAILGLLGRGTWGVVYRARDPRLSRDIALKVLVPEVVPGPAELTRFENEAKAAARLTHPNIVQIHEFGLHEGKPFCALELVEGIDLAKELQHSHYPGRKVAALIEELARAVDYAHRRGVVHRDLKPANVLLTAEGVPKVTDFGLAKRLDIDSAQTVDGTVMGTPSYMPPEQALGQTLLIGPKSDVFSLGAILYELLSGRAPFRGETVLETLELAQRSEPPPPSRIQPNVSRDLETICLKCLRREPEKRYASAAALADDLRRFLDGKPIEARPVSSWEKAAKLVKRHPALAAVTALLTVGLIAFVVTVLVFNVQLQEALQTAEQRSEQLRKGVYSLQLQRCAAIAASDPGRGRDFLEDEQLCPPDLRDFAWGHLYRTCQRGDPILHLEETDFRCLAISPDNTCFATGTADGTVAFWNEGESEPRWSLRQHARAVTAVDFSPDGRLAATSSEEGTVQLWEVDTGKQGVSFEVADGRVNDVAFAPDGRSIATADSDHAVRVWEVDTGKERPPGLETHGFSVFCVSFSSDGKFLASGSRDGVIRLWRIDGSQGTEPGQAPLKPVTELSDVHRGPVTDLKFQPNGDLLASASEDQRVLLWRVAPNGEATFESEFQGHEEKLSSLAFSPDGSQLAVGSYDHTISVLDVESCQRRLVFQRRLVLRGHDGEVSALAFTDDEHLLSADRAGRAILWDLVAGFRPLRLQKHTRPVTAVAFTRNGRDVISGSKDGKILLWNTHSGASDVVWKEDSGGWVSHLQVAATVPWLAWGSRGNVYWTQLPTGKELPRQLSSELLLLSSLALAADGSLLAAAGGGGRGICVWELPSGAERRLPEIDGLQESPSLAFSPDSGLLAAVSGAESVTLFDTRTGAEASTFRPLSEREEVQWLAFLPDGTMLAIGGNRGTLVLWDLTARLPRLCGDTGSVTCLAFSPDGKTLATGGKNGNILLWDATEITERCSIGGHQGPVLAMAFAPDSAALASGGFDHSVCIWKTAWPDRSTPPKRSQHSSGREAADKQAAERAPHGR